jgi:hypothetical protein
MGKLTMTMTMVMVTTTDRMSPTLGLQTLTNKS